MKKNSIHYILATALALLLTACNTAEIDNAVSDDLIEVPIRFSGDVTVTESPLTRAESNNDLYGIQVYQNGEPYAYGLFDDVSNVHLYCHSGSEYKIVCTMVRDGKNIIPIRNDNNNYNQCNYPSGSLPETRYTMVAFSGSGYAFICGIHYNIIKTGSYSGYVSIACVPISNGFVYSGQTSMKYLYISHIASSDGMASQYHDRFYGETDHFTPNGSTSLTLDLKRVSFSLQYSISGISDGSVSIDISNSNHTFFNDSGITASYTSPEITYCFDNILDAWQYADNYTENLTVHMVWTRGVGIVQDLGSQVIQVKRNADNVINIALDTN